MNYFKQKYQQMNSGLSIPKVAKKENKFTIYN